MDCIIQCFSSLINNPKRFTSASPIHTFIQSLYAQCFFYHTSFIHCQHSHQGKCQDTRLLSVSFSSLVKGRFSLQGFKANTVVNVIHSTPHLNQCGIANLKSHCVKSSHTYLHSKLTVTTTGVDPKCFINNSK